MRKVIAISTGMMLVMSQVIWGQDEDKQLCPMCPTHGVEVKLPVKIGDAITVSVTFDGKPAYDNCPVDLGIKKLGDKISIAVTAEDLDNHVCKGVEVNAVMLRNPLKVQA